MRIVIFIGIICVLLMGCTNKNSEQKKPVIDNNDQIQSNPFDIQDLRMNGNVKWEVVKSSDSFKSWRLDNDSIKIAVEIANNVWKQDSSISLYDNYLSLQSSKDDVFHISESELDGITVRWVERNYSNDVNYIEVLVKDLCGSHQLVISGMDISEEEMAWLKIGIQSIKWHCDN